VQLYEDKNLPSFSLMMLFMPYDHTKLNLFDTLPDFLINDCALFSSVVFIINEADNISDEFANHLMDNSNIFTRAPINPEDNVINAFPFNVHLGVINSIERFYVSHLQPLLERASDKKSPLFKFNISLVGTKEDEEDMMKF